MENENGQRKIVAFRATRENVNDAKRKAETLLKQRPDNAARVAVVISGEEFKTLTMLPFDLYMMNVRGIVEIITENPGESVADAVRRRHPGATVTEETENGREEEIGKAEEYGREEKPEIKSVTVVRNPETKKRMSKRPSVRIEPERKEEPEHMTVTVISYQPSPEETHPEPPRPTVRMTIATGAAETDSGEER